MLAIALFAALSQPDAAPSPVSAHDLSRFPGPQTVAAARTFNVAYRTNLLFRIDTELHHSWWLLDALGETNQLYRVWDALDDAQNADCPQRRLHHLLLLRDLIGAEAYAAGEMPACVPVGRFQEIRR